MLIFGLMPVEKIVIDYRITIRTEATMNDQTLFDTQGMRQDRPAARSSNPPTSHEAVGVVLRWLIWVDEQMDAWAMVRRTCFRGSKG